MRTIFILLFLLLNINVMSQSQFRKEWHTIDSLTNLGQMQTALQLINSIYDQAKASGQYDQFLKATLYKLNYEGSFMENHYKTAIERTEQDIQSAPAPVKQVLHSIVADLYWKYYEENRWRILDRTATVNFEQNDLYTWDLRKIVATCMEHYASSLNEKELLIPTPISAFNEILYKKEDSEKYRPTLFDLLAYRAIDFYASSEAGLTRPAQTFSMNDAAYFSPYSQFAQLNIASPDSFSFEWQTMKLYQEVIKSHMKDADPSPLIDVELKRLSFVHQKSVLNEKDSLYLGALQQLAGQFTDHPSSAEIAYAIASLLAEDDQPIFPYDEENAPAVIPESKKWDRKKAMEICQQAMDRFPGTLGARNCLALKDRIQQPTLTITTSEAVCIDKPSLALVDYQNISKVYFRLIKMDPYNRDREYMGFNENLLEKYRNMSPEKTWEQPLPDDGDYRSHSAEISLPAMPAGYYVLLASTNPSFPDSSGTTHARVTANHLWVSNISSLYKQNNRFMVLHRASGMPLEGVKVQILYRNYNREVQKDEFQTGEVLTTDVQGMVTIPAANLTTSTRNFFLVFKSGDDQLIPENNFWSSSVSGNEKPSYEKTFFFTDRAIYRPGQMIFFKGIMVEHKGKEVGIQANTKTEVTFYDSNNQVISRQHLTTNDFGTFSGSFTAPQGVLNGQMSIRNRTGNLSVHVEEYKRPKFEVTFPPVEGLYKLGQVITVKGSAITYAQSAVTGAKVHYRVVRGTRYPNPWSHWRRMHRTPETEILSGDTITASDGSFEVSFKADPDPSTDPESDVQFNYTVTADVTDINGESHSKETQISLGYKALVVTTNLEQEVNLEKEFRINLSTTNLNGKAEAATGTLQLYQFQKPRQTLYPRKWARPDRHTMTRRKFEKLFPGEIYANEDDSTTWPREMIYTTSFSTPADSVITPGKAINPGIYWIKITTKDAFGEEVRYQKLFNAYEPKSNKTETAAPLALTLLTPTVEPGQEALFLIAAPIKKAKVVMEVMQQNKVLKREIIPMDREQQLIRIPVTEEHRGNFSLQLTMVSNNRLFTESALVQVPYTHKKLDIRFSTFRNKLLPGQEEEWQLTLTGHQGEKVAAEMLASMYDASLDAFTPHNWWFHIYDSYGKSLSWSSNRSFGSASGYQLIHDEIFFPLYNREYDQLKGQYGFATDGVFSIADVKGYDEEQSMDIAELNTSINIEEEMSFSGSAQRKVEVTTLSDVKISPMMRADEEVLEDLPLPKPTAAPAIQIRKNFNETSFFYPNLTTNEKGEIIIRFKAPEALTRWKFMGLAHTKELQYGEIEKTLITQKELMIFTNAPRFMREGDHLDFSAKISNISDHDLSGNAEVHFFDALSMQSIDSILGLTASTIPFTAAKGGSAPVSWKISIPEGLQAITYRITATAGSFSDGEEAAIPVLSNRMLVTESMPLPVKRNQTKEFTFAKLVNSNSVSSTLRNYRLSLEYTSNPAWYAVQALPYLMEFPHECAEQLFSRYYANSLATHIANSDPKIKRVFESWKNISPDALKSNLEKNEELKSVLLQESPWVREAASEHERRQRIALLFDLNRMASEQAAALKKLGEMQYPGGAWPWFPGMPENRTITQHIVTGLGHLNTLKIINLLNNDATLRMLSKAIQYLDTTMRTDFEKLKKQDKDYLKNNHLGYEEMHYLYARSYFLSTHPMGKNMDELLGYYKGQSVKYWNKQNNYMKGMIALYLNRLGDQKTAMLIMRSLKETALHKEEMGMYWRDNQPSWHWFQAPIETQALLIEGFEEVSQDRQSVEEMKIWLLKQKQTQDWKTTKATAEAVYALLLRGTSLLASDKQVEIILGDQKVDPFKEGGIQPQAGTGYFKTSWEASTITPQMGMVRVTNPNPTVAWGALYWQYFEQLDKITPAQTPLRLDKKLFREVDSPTGPVIEPISENAAIKVGDRIVVRIELRTDRSMEYLHLKDMRASAFEPVNVLSGYRYQGGLGYYESTLDASTNFFISYLPQGTYVFEYKLTATQKGEFSNGNTSIQCMYAPEFTSHSEGIRIKVE